MLYRITLNCKEMAQGKYKTQNYYIKKMIGYMSSMNVTTIGR